MNPYRDGYYGSEALGRMRAPWWRRLLCRIGWHSTDAVFEITSPAVNFEGEHGRAWVRDGTLTYTRRIAVHHLCTSCGRLRLMATMNKTGGLTAARGSRWIGGREAARILARCYRSPLEARLAAARAGWSSSRALDVQTADMHIGFEQVGDTKLCVDCREAWPCAGKRARSEVPV